MQGENIGDLLDSSGDRESYRSSQIFRSSGGEGSDVMRRRSTGEGEGKEGRRE